MLSFGFGENKKKFHDKIILGTIPTSYEIYIHTQIEYQNLSLRFKGAKILDTQIEIVEVNL